MRNDGLQIPLPTKETSAQTEVTGTTAHHAELLENLSKRYVWRRKPLVIVLFAWLHFLAPISNLLLNAKLNGMSVSRYLNFYFQLHILVPGLLLPMLAGAFVLICKRWSLYLYIVTMTVLAGFNFVRYQQSGGNPFFMFAGIAINILVVAYFMRPGIRVFYLDQAMRFWETAPRFKWEIPAFLGTPAGQIEVVIDNISETGVFVVSSQILPTENASVDLKFQYMDIEYVFPGCVVRVDHAALAIAIEFDHNKDTKMKIRHLTTTFLRQGVPIQKRNRRARGRSTSKSAA